MKRRRFTEEQIIEVLREHEAGAKAGDLARRQAGSCRSSEREVPDERAPDQHRDRGGSQDNPVPLVPAT